MSKKSKLLSALLVIAMLISCMAISVFAEEAPAEPTPPATTEVTNADGSITIKEGFVIPADQATKFADPAAYPWAIFGKGEEDDGFNFMEALPYYCNDDSSGNAVLRWFGAWNSVNSSLRNYRMTYNKDIIVVLRSDYTCGAKDTTNWNDNKISSKSLIFDLNGKTLDLATQPLYHSNMKDITYVEELYRTQNLYGLNIVYTNGTIKSSGDHLVFIQRQTDKVTLGKHIDITLDGITLVKNANLLNLVNTADLSLFSADTEFVDDICEVNLNFKNCATVGENPGEDAPLPMTINQAGTNEKIPITINCEHNDANGNGVCDVCGYVAPVPFTVTTLFGESFKITYTSKLAAIVTAVEITDATGTVTKTVGTDLVAGEDGNFVIEFEIPADAMTQVVSVKLLNEAGEAVPMVNAAGAVIEAYSANIFDAINDKIDESNKDVADEIEKIKAEIEAKTEELKLALNDKVSAADLSVLIGELETTIREGYELQDELLAEELEDAAGELSDLEVTLANAKTTLETAIKKVEDDLAAAVASLNAAIALKADAAKLTEEIAKVSAAYAAADLVLTENDEALAAADASLKAAIDKLRADVDDHTARLDSIDTMNIVQLVLVIVVALAAVAALVLPMVKGKKKEQE